ncbi:gamma-glutamylaminecyclotransferase-like [Gigantopelta aegis]|uniref:gamma-glutamylaminecyclotransferase-like n=1 Tax=Gigantopelta aegis TaxID=1735272 RepID=UPI001B88E160|nr:gamma-glutamylaminecyclotransferase-like [Gigantopelta aegis]
MSSKKILSFVYGTLKRGQPNHYRLGEEYGTSVLVGSARTVQQLPLVIASKYNIPFLLYAAGKGTNVVGEIYEIDEKMLENLDEFECHPTFYERDIVMVIQTHDAQDKELKEPIKVECYCYYLKKYKPELLDGPVFENYEAFGSHGHHYVIRCEEDRQANNGYHPAMDVVAA